jgi:hypothetical protein
VLFDELADAPHEAVIQGLRTASLGCTEGCDDAVAVQKQDTQNSPPYTRSEV